MYSVGVSSFHASFPLPHDSTTTAMKLTLVPIAAVALCACVTDAATKFAKDCTQEQRQKVNQLLRQDVNPAKSCYSKAKGDITTLSTSRLCPIAECKTWIDYMAENAPNCIYDDTNYGDSYKQKAKDCADPSSAGSGDAGNSSAGSKGDGKKDSSKDSSSSSDSDAVVTTKTPKPKPTSVTTSSSSGSFEIEVPDTDNSTVSVPDEETPEPSVTDVVTPEPSAAGSHFLAAGCAAVVGLVASMMI
ncbi:hypothetical protein Poli38472_006255 [Pythium oligandrum]|uniref:Uncharacterized protein n=1 Tax=Pythium oligandrum TaxID=41045 RepID=A0A8K1CU01_PYTOL|nr:hypothetical protein Poli38472_006255 [Pythium oligandrum]|eukprot:TMW68787.1 hypothetical protein Poli38472_006255 [Pythium oligandrum]